MDEAPQPIQNEDYKIPNYAFMDPTHVVIHGHRHGEEGAYQFQPCVTLFFNNDAQPTVALNIFLHEFYEDSETMATMTVAWANRMWGHVSKKVSIFDPDDSMIAKHDVMDLIAIENAIEELYEIQRTNIHQIH